jgi:hypothetical protein
MIKIETDQDTQKDYIPLRFRDSFYYTKDDFNKPID